MATRAQQPKETERRLVVKTLPEGFVVESDTLAREIKDITIDSDPEYEYWASRSLAGNNLVKKIEAYHEETKRQADQLHKSIVKLIRDSTDPIKRSVSVIDRALMDYRRKKFEEAEAQRKVLQDEADRQHDDLTIAHAEQLQKTGDEAGAELVLEAGAQSKPVVAITDSAPPKVAGLSFRKGWDFELVDATGKVVEDSPLLPREYLMPNETAIGKVVAALGDKAKIPGVRVKPVESTTKRRS